MMKYDGTNIAVLMGSPRKRDSYQICRLIEQSFHSTPDVTFDYLFLKDYHIEDCRGCDQCFRKGEKFCPCRDDLEILKEKLLAADGIIFASPVYACQITGSLKRVIDRLSYLFHRQELVGKPALTVVTTGGGGLKPAGNYLKMTACGWGCHLIGELGIMSPRFFERSQESASAFGYNKRYHDAELRNIRLLAGKFKDAVNRQELPVPSFYDIFLFQCLRSKTFVSKVDYEYWEMRGWLESRYYYDVKMNPAKKMFARMMKAYIDAVARRMFGTAKPQ